MYNSTLFALLDVSEDSGVKTKMGTPRDGLPSIPPIGRATVLYCTTWY